MKTEQPYIITTETVIVTHRAFNPAYGSDRICKCGHTYERHFDPYEDYEAVGCKYCRCGDFVEETGAQRLVRKTVTKLPWAAQDVIRKFYKRDY